MEKICKAIDAVNEAMGYLCGWLTLLLAILVAYEVVARYVFNAPTIWSMEINQYLFLTVCVVAGGYGILTDGHVRVDLFYPKFSPRVQGIVEMSTYPAALALCFVLVWLGGGEFLKHLKSGDTSGTVLNFPLWPVWFMVPFAGLLMALQILAKYIRHIKMLAVGKD